MCVDFELLRYGLDEDAQTEKIVRPHPNKHHIFLTHHNIKNLLIRRELFKTYGAGVLAYLQ